MTITVNFSALSDADPFVATTGGLAESSAGDSQIISGLLRAKSSTQNFFSAPSATPNQSVEITFEYPAAGSVIGESLYNPRPYVLMQDLDNYVYLATTYEGTDDTRVRLFTRIAGVETQIGGFSPGFSDAAILSGSRQWKLEVSWSGADATFTFYDAGGAAYGTPIVINGFALTTGVPGWITQSDVGTGDYVGISNAILEDGAAPAVITVDLIDDSDSGTVDFHPGETGCTLTVSGVGPGANTGNVNLSFIDAAGPAFTVDSVTYDDADTVTIGFTVTTGMELLFDIDTGYQLYFDINGDTGTTASYHNYLPSPTLKFKVLSGTIVKSVLWETGADFAAAQEVFAPSTNNVWQSPAGVINSTVEPAAGVADWVLVRPATSFCDGWDASGNEPVAGAQAVFNAVTNVTSKNIDCNDDGTYVVTELTENETATCYFIDASDGSNGAPFVVTFQAVAADVTPDAFSFTDQTGVALSTLIVSNSITVAGITAAAAISITGGEYAINGGSYTSSAGTVDVDDTVTVRVTSSGSNSTAVNATLTIGGVSDTFTATTLAASDSTPDAFSFTDQTGVALSSVITSAPITVAGIDIPAAISIAGGTYSINGGSYTASAGTVTNGQTVTVRVTSSASNSTAVNATLTIGGVSDTFTATTVAAGDSTPNAFTFVDQTDVALSTLIISAPITITGIDTTTAISITGGEYSKNGGSYTSSAGTVVVNDVIRVRVTSSASGSTAVSATLTVGGVSDTFSATTVAVATQVLDIVSLGAFTRISSLGVATARTAETGIKVFLMAMDGSQVMYDPAFAINASGIATANIDVTELGDPVGTDYYISFVFADGLNPPTFIITSEAS